jgi:hypothetical protein
MGTELNIKELEAIYIQDSEDARKKCLATKGGA